MPTSNSVPAPLRAPINPAGPVSAEWWRYFQSLQTAGSAIDSNSAAIGTLESELASAQALLKALQAEVAAIPTATTTTTPAAAPVREIPAGVLDGVNTKFTLSYVPASAAGLTVTLNGNVQEQGRWYSLLSNQIFFTIAPRAGDRLVATYTH